jgi:hypothetical protein
MLHSDGEPKPGRSDSLGFVVRRPASAAAASGWARLDLRIRALAPLFRTPTRPPARRLHPCVLTFIEDLAQESASTAFPACRVRRVLYWGLLSVAFAYYNHVEWQLQVCFSQFDSEGL